MSYFESEDTPCRTDPGALALLIEPRPTDLGEFSVRRALPSRERRMIGPFVFFDHMGPAEFPPGKGIAVRPHPHIGIATITYLFEGEIMHRDSLGVIQPIQAGAGGCGSGRAVPPARHPELDRAARTAAGMCAGIYALQCGGTA